MQTLSVLAFSLTAVAGFAPTIRLAPRTVAPVSVVSPIQMNFFDDMQRNFAKMMGQDAPSIDEAMEMCRDDESSGCTLEMCVHCLECAISQCCRLLHTYPHQVHTCARACHWSHDQRTTTHSSALDRSRSLAQARPHRPGEGCCAAGRVPALEQGD